MTTAYLRANETLMFIEHIAGVPDEHFGSWLAAFRAAANQSRRTGRRHQVRRGRCFGGGHCWMYAEVGT